MKNILGLLTGILILSLHSYSFATPYQVPSSFTSLAPGISINVVDDPGDTNDAYAAVAEWGEKYALTSIQGTHSNVKAISKYQYGFTVQGASSVELQISYTLMAELLSLNQATVSTRAIMGIYRYYPAIYGGTLTNGWPVWQDQITLETGGEPLDQPYDYYSEKIGTTSTVTLPSAYYSGKYQYMVELYAESWGWDTHYIPFTAGEYENPDAWYSAAAYVDPIFTVLTPGATITEFLIPSGSNTLSGGELDPPGILQPSNPVPLPPTMLLFGTGLAGLAGTKLRRKKK